MTHDDLDEEVEEVETETERSEYDFFNPMAKNHQPHHLKHDFTETEREEVECSEWGDHYSTTSSSEDDDRDSRSEMGVRSNFGSSVRAESVAAPAPAPPRYAATASKSEDSSASYRSREISDMKMVVRHRDLKEIVEAIKENFEKAAAAGDQVSEILETGRAQLDRSFSQLKSKSFSSIGLLQNCSFFIFFIFFMVL